jgi:hypothetical protein
MKWQRAARHPMIRCTPFILNWAHPSDGRNLLWVGFDAVLRYDEPEQHTSRDPENAFLGLSFMPFS